MTLTVALQPLTAACFAAFGDVIECAGQPLSINQGQTERYHALSLPQVAGEAASIGLSIFRNLQASTLPLQIDMLERHPQGSQSFIPMDGQAFVIVVALPLDDRQPDEAQVCAFLSNGQQGITYARGVWHHPLITLEAPSNFLVVDRIGTGHNCDIHQLSQPCLIRVETAVPVAN
ncbi:ureidoglycolate lyase [Alkanindiges illinoisensis]|uniref:ureidoglycolate lyase n=1 Tax=Alkanindiges illinoisensis TaxID=197183 RepID=UPI00047AAA42|nr:ureidoglycolate lyase [Alkanindiges illinoisensis]